jgi:DNA-binding NarL/FixJ family response regulator
LLLVDDHEVLRMGLRTLFAEAGGFEVVGEAGTAADATALAARVKPDVVLMDVRLPDRSGVEACREIRARRSATRVLFLTSFADEGAVMATVLAGADGFLLKEVGGEELVKAVRTVAEGRAVLDPAVTGSMLARIKALADPAREPTEEPLSPQEQRVLALVAEGRTNKEIAVALGLSEKTVGNYLGHVFQKLHVTRRSQAAVYFSKHFPSTR